MKAFISFPLILAVLLAGCPSCNRLESTEADRFSELGFADPPMQYRPIPLWFWNDTEVDLQGVRSQLRQMVEKDGYGGCAILPFGRGFKPEYLGPEYMQIYAAAVELADSLGVRMSLYDEYGFPSGSMGFSNADGVPRFQIAHPDMCIKRLDKHEIPAVNGGEVRYDLTSLEGKFMAAAAYDTLSHQSVSLRGFVKDDVLSWTAPSQGAWKVIVFECVIDGKPRLNYLDKEAVACFIQDTHEKYYALFADKFGKVITSTFFDEPTMYYGQGRMWTENFNEEFVARYGMEPDAFYPALWYDIGDATPAARNMMFGLHTALYAEAFTKSVAEWAESHGVPSTGHQDQEELANTTGASGDLMLHGKYMTMPGIDKIGGDRPAELFYKVVSSSANNWDKIEVMSETYGAMGDIPVSQMRSIAIEQFTKGITNLIPHAVWYDDSKVTFPPELSWRNPVYRDSLPDFNKFLSRLRYAFARPGRHVADIAVLYPVQTQYAGHCFDGPLGPVQGSVEVPGTDYPKVSRVLTDELGKDFTYIHPEVLDGRSTVSEGLLTMANKVNSESFKVLILPGVGTISLSNISKVFEAWKSGIKVIFTTQLPCHAADFGVDDGLVCDKVRTMLESAENPAVFVSEPSASALADALSGLDGDVEFMSGCEPFNYIHKVVDGGDLFLFGNIDNNARSQKVSLSGKYDAVRLMNPHTGECSDAEVAFEDGRTVLSLELEPSQAMLICCNRQM